MPDYRAKVKTTPQIPLEVRSPTGRTRWANVQEILRAVPSPVKKVGRAVLPVSTVALSLPAVARAQEQYNENPNALNWAQLQSERVALGGSSLSAASTPLLFTPLAPVGVAGIAVGETIDLVGTGSSLTTDVIKGALNPAVISTKNRQKYRHYRARSTPSYVARPTPTPQPSQELVGR